MFRSLPSSFFSPTRQVFAVTSTLGAFMFSHAGCKSENELENNKEDVVEPREIDCPQWDCVESVYVPLDEMPAFFACLGYDAETGEWENSPPLWMTCADPLIEEDCTIQTEMTTVEGETGDCETGCAEGEAEDSPADECCFEAGETSEIEEHFLEGELGAANEIIELLSACEVEAVKLVECEFVVGEASLTTTECPAGAMAQTAGADYAVEVEAARSYVTVHTSTGHDTVPLTGMGAVGAGPAEFLSAIVDATQTLDLGSDDYSNWRFWFTADISMNTNSSSFVVPHAQGYQIKGRGKLNQQWMTMTLGSLANATGQFNAGTGRWQLNYASSFPGGWVQMHLEGPYYGTSSP
jgi:hypothetical protein